MQSHQKKKQAILSKFMRQINVNYAIYFNKKNRRSGHLWQGRFQSWYIGDEAYLCTLILYIEQNYQNDKESIRAFLESPIIIGVRR